MQCQLSELKKVPSSKLACGPCQAKPGLARVGLLAPGPEEAASVVELIDIIILSQ